MRRVTIVLAAAFAFVLLAAATAHVLMGSRALKTGAAIYFYRTGVGARLTTPEDRTPLIVYLGDSTIAMGNSYPAVLSGLLSVHAGLSTRVVSGPGFDPFHEYCLLGAVLDLEPAAVVMVAHLRLFDTRTRAATWSLADLCSFLPPAELPRALRLPLTVRGLSSARLLMLQLLRSERVEHAVF